MTPEPTMTGDPVRSMTSEPVGTPKAGPAQERAGRAPRSVRRPGHGRRVVALLLALSGLGVLVATWVLTTPPFTLYDEFDHAFRGSAVAHGQVVAPPSDATRGTGAMVATERDLVEAARAGCQRLPYTTARDCLPGRSLGGGLVEMPTGAGRYNPTYYLLVGWAGLPTEGTTTLVVQRCLSAVLCLGLIAAAGTTLIRLRGGRPITALVLACSPMLLVSLALMAPNGLEMAAAICWWSCLIALGRGDRHRATWVLAGVSGALLALTRGLGPLWLAGAVATVVIWNWGGVRAVVTGQRRRAAMLAGTVGAATAGAVAWTTTQGALEIGHVRGGETRSLVEGIAYSAQYFLVKVIQLIAAYPGRDIAPSSWTVAGWLIAFGVGVGGALLATDRRARVALGLLSLALLGLPLVIEGSQVSTFGLAWQGRYILPLAVGLPLLACTSIRPVPRRRIGVDKLAIAAGLMTSMISATAAGLNELRQLSMIDVPGSWQPVPGALLIALACLGGGLLAAAVLTEPWPELGRDAAGPSSPPDPDTVARPAAAGEDRSLP